MTDEVYSYGGTVSYRPVLDSAAVGVQIPKPQLEGAWLHIPYSNIQAWETDSGVHETVWNVRVWLPTAADYIALQGLHGVFASLGTPFGTFSALLRSIDGFQQRSDGAYVGNCVWEWSNQ